MSDTVTPVEEEEEVVTTPVTEEVTEEVVNTPAIEEDTSYLDMSDEDFEKQLSAGGTPVQPAETEVAEEVIEDKGAAEPVTETTTPATEAAKPATTETKTDPAPAAQPAPSGEVDPLAVTDEVAIAGYKELMAPFKANGKTVQARTPQEALRLMQMGAGHIKYQNQVRPALARAKTLENNKITDSDLNFLIELHNKNPDAIKKLVRDSGIDPYDINTDDASKAADKDYRPKDYSASEAQVTLEETLSDMQSSDTGSQLLKHVRETWDDGSRRMVLEDPAILTVLNEQKESGVYDRIVDEIDRRRSLGGLANVSFLNAYHTVGIEMDQAGAFAKEPTGETPGQPGAAPAPTVQKSEVIATKAATPKQPANPDAVKAIAPVKTVVSAKPIPDNILDMSDEDFAKLEKQFG